MFFLWSRAWHIVFVSACRLHGFHGMSRLRLDLIFRVLIELDIVQRWPFNPFAMEEHTPLAMACILRCFLAVLLRVSEPEILESYAA